MRTKNVNTDWHSYTLFSCFDTAQEADLYYSLKEYLMLADVWQSAHVPLLHRYVKMQFEWIELLKKNNKHYMLDKMASHIGELEKELCLTPQSMLKYQKDKVLMTAKKDKIEKDKKENKSV